MSRLPPGRLDALLDSGQLAALARECRTQAEMAKRLGITTDAITAWRKRREEKGLPAPTLWDLQRGDIGQAWRALGERYPIAAAQQDPIDTARDDSAAAPAGLPDRDTQNRASGTQDGDIGNLDTTNLAGTSSSLVDDFSEEEPTIPGVPLPVLPQHHIARGVSTLVDAEGNVKQQWIKTSRTFDQIQDIAAAFMAIKDDLPRLDAPIPAPTGPINPSQLAAYLLGDCHVGMHAWRGDAGANFDLKIAEHNLTTLTSHLVDLSPPTERALIVNIGDYFHSDNRGNTTTKGTPVDVDGRWSKVLEVGIRIMRRIIESALGKHDHVTVINEIGNHDTHTSIFLSLALAQFYESEPRVTIDTSPRMFHYYRFGKVLIMTHHGHNVKPRDLVGVMASDRAQEWGETLFRYIYTGHIHHERSCEFPGAYWRSLRSPASADAWHDSMGYRSGHELSLEILDAERGLVNRHIVGVPRDLGRAA